jgi:protein O-mannosyl-transferase
LPKTYPYFLAGWLWYVISLIPVIGLVQVGRQSMADRYTYIPLIGIFVIIAWGVPDLVSRSSRRLTRDAATMLAVSGTAVLLILAVCAWTQVSHWQNSYTLWKRAVDCTEGNFVAMNNLSSALPAGSSKEGIRLLTEATRLEPRYVEAHFNLASRLSEEKDYEAALPHYAAAARLAPTFVQAKQALAQTCNNFGITLWRKQRYAAAEYQFREAIKIDPRYPDPHSNLALTLYSKGKYREAWTEIEAYRGMGGVPPSALIDLLSQKMPEPKK